MDIRQIFRVRLGTPRLERPLAFVQPCPMGVTPLHGSLPKHSLWWLTCELHYSPLLWRLGSVYQLWKSPLLSCAPWSSDQPTCLSSQCMSWSSSCKGNGRSLRSSPHPWPCPVDEPQCSVAFGEDVPVWWAFANATRFQNSCECLAQSFHIWHGNLTFVFASRNVVNT